MTEFTSVDKYYVVFIIFVNRVACKDNFCLPKRLLAVFQW